ncbi:MAG: outer membrane protein [Afipia sp.]
MNMRFLVTAAVAAVVFTSAAHAADLPRKYVKAPVPVAAPFSWTGFYVGAHGGGGWGKNDWQDFIDPINGLNGPAPGSNVPGPDAKYRMSGALAGGQIGYNWQTGWTVFGIEADASWTDIKGSGNNAPNTFLNPPGVGCMQWAANGCTSKIEALGTITGRVGAAFDHALLYVKGGAAWAIEKHTATANDFGPPPNFDPIIVGAETSQTRWGWTAGAGIEYAFAANWSVKAEYNYIDLGNDRVTFNYASGQVPPGSASVERILHVAKAGINYRF